MGNLGLRPGLTECKKPISCSCRWRRFLFDLMTLCPPFSPPLYTKLPCCTVGTSHDTSILQGPTKYLTGNRPQWDVQTVTLIRPITVKFIVYLLCRNWQWTCPIHTREKHYFLAATSDKRFVCFTLFVNWMVCFIKRVSFHDQCRFEMYYRSILYVGGRIWSTASI
jgi:hypothetical protein